MGGRFGGVVAAGGEPGPESEKCSFDRKVTLGPRAAVLFVDVPALGEREGPPEP